MVFQIYVLEVLVTSLPFGTMLEVLFATESFDWYADTILGDCNM